MAEEIKLPEPVAWIAEYGGDVYTADQLRAAVEADRAKRALGGYSEDQIAQAAMEAEIPDAKLESLLIALASTPAAQQPLTDEDKRLLEMAAKAAGGLVYVPEIASWIHEDANGNRGSWWRPLDDDGDALRLFTKMPFREMYVSKIGVTVSWRREGSRHGLKCDEYANEHGGDLNAATRRAIVRAAAAMTPKKDTTAAQRKAAEQVHGIGVKT